MTPTSLEQLLRQRRTLLLQGPMGPFFARLAEVLATHGQTVRKVNFNGGDDRFFGGEATTRYAGRLEDWPARFESLVREERFDAVVLFGQSRPLHRAAIDVARRLGVTVYVFEEGYIRPDHVTLEIDGVNGASRMPKDAAFYRAQPGVTTPDIVSTGQRFRQVAAYAIAYSLAVHAGRRRYPHYAHHRSLAPVREGLRWVKSGWRKQACRWSERGELALLSAPERQKRYFLSPLQVWNDSQIREYSAFADMPAFIALVMRSFASSAPADHWLVFKHHPLDRPYNDYAAIIRRLAAETGLGGRVRYVHDLHLPTLLRHAAGVVTVNSTTGVQALYHGTPVKVLGGAFYAVEGLVNANPLDQFWRQPGVVDEDLFARFRAHLLRENQLNASFYAEAPGLPAIKDATRLRAFDGSDPSADAQAAS